MVMRAWRGAVRPADLDRYLVHQDRTDIGAYRDTEGNRGVLVLTRETGDVVEIVTLSFWDDRDAVRRFGGDDPERRSSIPGATPLDPRRAPRGWSPGRSARASSRRCAKWGHAA